MLKNVLLTKDIMKKDNLFHLENDSIDIPSSGEGMSGLNQETLAHRTRRAAEQE